MLRNADLKFRVVAVGGWLLLAVACGDDDAAVIDASPPDAALTAYDLCVRACIDESPAGEQLFDEFATCVEDACSQFPPGSPEADECSFVAWDPGNPAAACAAETAACFSGTIAGCNELAEAIAAECEPDNLPITTEEEGAALLWCILENGWRGAPEAQQLAWATYLCVFPLDDSPGCYDECSGGEAPCRACAQTKCTAPYDACLAQSAAVVDDPPSAAKAGCQQINTCINFNCF